MDFAMRLAEERMRHSIDKGDFDHLPGKGQPLPDDDMSGVPEDLRMGYKILKNAGAVPEEVQLKKDMATLEQLIACTEDDAEKTQLRKQWNQQSIRFNQLIEKKQMRGNASFRKYRSKIHNKMGL
ncbi:J-domain-containing protein [Tuberibacillus sp. Marseille-P3662]|uniref:DnaJ family domain-containing protein n=1 Tax=Tuberibacillus sp. Marseille-P3662 TaxID=1965358 RepID=UPI000A1CC849|nr:DUF1992 domain-containing protein [Tuberibacillus sp. Marseille-P3662]